VRFRRFCPVLSVGPRSLPGMAIARFKDLCIDAGDPAPLARFWAGVLGLEATPLDDGDAQVTGPTPGHTIWVNRVPEPKTVKQRAHWDIYTTSLAELEALGAIPVEQFPKWTVMR